MEAIADWLDVTFSPDSNPRDELRLFLRNIGFETDSYVHDRELWTPSDPSFRGVLISELKPNSHVRISCSGGSLAYLREISQFTNFLALLSDYPHRVTRLDAAYDVHEDAPKLLRSLRRKYPRECSLNRQRPLRCHYLTTARPDGQISGTMYVGHRSRGRVTARVYDKMLEALEKRSELISPTTRYELTFRDGLASLWDALKPTAIFWHHSGALLSPPDSPPVWVPDATEGWHYERPSVLPAVQLSRLVSDSSDLSVLLSLADELGKEGRNLLAHELLKRLGVRPRGQYFEKESTYGKAV